MKLRKRTTPTESPPQEFPPLSRTELADILGVTIKRDSQNAIVTFLAMLSAYTKDAQINVSFNAPSSAGKSYIPIEVKGLFPPQDVLTLGHASPSSFFHDTAKVDPKTGHHVVDFRHKIIVFLDMPHTQLLERLRPVLSHDEPVTEVKITDRAKGGSLQAKTIDIIGFPAVIFCTANVTTDEQEATRMLMLSPELTQSKLRAGVALKIKRECNRARFNATLEKDEARAHLKERIKAVREAHIDSIDVANPERVTDLFFGRHRKLKARHMRDVAHLLDLVKALALLNLWHRERRGSTIIANDQDIEEAFALWDSFGTSQELGLPPYVYAVYTDVIVPAYREKSRSVWCQGSERGLTRQDIIVKYQEVFHQSLSEDVLRRQILPMLAGAGLIRLEPSSTDRRKTLILLPLLEEAAPASAGISSSLSASANTSARSISSTTERGKETPLMPPKRRFLRRRRPKDENPAATGTGGAK